nr:uncharacterized protein LOC109166267 [Ipomoea batatas]
MHVNVCFTGDGVRCSCSYMIFHNGIINRVGEVKYLGGDYEILKLLKSDNNDVIALLNEDNSGKHLEI